MFLILNLEHYPGSADVAAEFEFTVDRTDDGTPDSPWSPADSVVSTFPDAGVFTVRGRIRGKDDGIGEATAAVLSPSQAADVIADAIAALRDGGSLNGGQANAVLRKIQHAKERYEDGEVDDALQQLRVLLHQVETFGRTGVLTESESAELAFLINQLVLSMLATP